MAISTKKTAPLRDQILQAVSQWKETINHLPAFQEGQMGAQGAALAEAIQIQKGLEEATQMIRQFRTEIEERVTFPNRTTRPENSSSVHDAQLPD